MYRGILVDEGVLRSIGILGGTEQYWDIRGYKRILGY